MLQDNDIAVHDVPPDHRFPPRLQSERLSIWLDSEALHSNGNTPANLLLLLTSIRIPGRDIAQQRNINHPLPQIFQGRTHSQGTGLSRLRFEHALAFQGVEV